MIVIGGRRDFIIIVMVIDREKMKVIVTVIYLLSLIILCITLLHIITFVLVLLTGRANNIALFWEACHLGALTVKLFVYPD